MMPQSFSAFAMVGAAAFVTSAAVACVAPRVDDEAAKTKAKAYVESTIASKVEKLDVLKKELVAANADRSGWAAYTEDWKAWNAEQAEKNKDSYSYQEWVWSSKKDKEYRNKHTSTPAAKAIKEIQDGTSGVVSEFFVTDAKGGNVAQTQVTSDWFQGDEAKFKDPIAAGAITTDKPKRDETTGETGVHVSIPIYQTDASGTKSLLGVAVVLIVIDKIK